MDFKFYLNSQVLPDYTNVEEIKEHNANEVTALDGTLNVDFINYRRGWRLQWDLISFDDYTTIKDIWSSQFSSKVFPHLLIPKFNISTPAYVKLNTDRLRFTGKWVQNFSIEILEQDAIS